MFAEIARLGPVAGDEMDRVFNRGLGMALVLDAGSVDEALRVGTDQAGKGDEDAMDFGLLFFNQADELVVLLDGFEGFDVDGLAGRAGSVDDAGDAALELAADGDDEAIAADGNELFLRLPVGREAAQRRAQRISDEPLLA